MVASATLCDRITCNGQARSRSHDHDHDHDHDRDDDHDHYHAAGVVGSARSAERAPTGSAVVFDIGDGIGALIVRLNDRLAGTELRIECIDDPSLHVHTGVWRRLMNGNDAVIAVYPELPAGRYRFPADDDHAGSDVVIVSGEIADLDLRTAQAAG